MKLKKIIIMSIILLFGILTFGNINSYAASGSFSVSKSSISLEKGKSTTFTINLKNCEGVFTISSSNTSVATVSMSKTGWLESKATVTIKAKAKGTATIRVKAEDVADSSAKEVTGTKSIKVTVTDSSSNTSNKPSTTNNSSNNNNNNTNNSSNDNENKKSNVATLKNLGITPNDFSGFRKMTLNYSVKVPNSVSKIKIYADPTDSKATVTGTGNKNLKVGKNTFAIKVTAEDKKTTKTYVLNITREEKKEEKEPEENTVENNDVEENKIDETPAETKKEGLSNLEISGFTLNPVFSQDNYEYNVDVPSDKKSLDIKTEKTNDNITVEVVGNENLKLGENVITLLVYNSKKENIATYQIFANLKEEKADVAGVNSLYKHEKQKELGKRVIIIVAIIVIILIIIIFITKKNKMIEKEFKDDKEEDRLPKMLQEEKKEKTVKKHNKSKGNHFK